MVRESRILIITSQNRFRRHETTFIRGNLPHLYENTVVPPLKIPENHCFCLEPGFNKVPVTPEELWPRQFPDIDTKFGAQFSAMSAQRLLALLSVLCFPRTELMAPYIVWKT